MIFEVVLVFSFDKTDLVGMMNYAVKKSQVETLSLDEFLIKLLAPKEPFPPYAINCSLSDLFCHHS